MKRKKEILYPENYHHYCPFSVQYYDNGYGRVIPGKPLCTDLCALYNLEKHECSIYLTMEEHRATQKSLKAAAISVKRAADKYTAKG